MKVRAVGVPEEHWIPMGYVNLVTFDSACQSLSVDQDPHRKARALPGVALIADVPSFVDLYGAMLLLDPDRVWAFSVWLLHGSQSQRVQQVAPKIFASATAGK